MRIFVTGIGGFIGGYLASKLSRHEIYGLSLFETESPNILQGDIRDFDRIKEILEEVKPDIIIHLASITAVKDSFDVPLKVFETNCIGTINIATAALQACPSLKKFIFSGTVEEYGNQDTSPIKEDVQLNPNSPYGAAKVSAEKYLRMLYEVYGFPCVLLRQTNTYGRKGNKAFVMEHIITQMLAKKDPVLMGFPDPVRDFMFIDDLLAFYELAVEEDVPMGTPMNISTGKGISIRELVEKIGEMLDYHGQVLYYTTSLRPVEINSLVADNSKVTSLTSWRPETDLDTGLKRTIELWK